jgi:flavin-dependent dehydrogenase
LDRPRFELFLLRAAEQAGACVRRGASVHSVTRAKSSWEVETPAGTLRCPWLVEATGRWPCLSRHLALRRQTWGRLTSVFAVAQTAAHPDQDSRTLIESGPDGWWYTALVPGGRRTISWQTEAPLLHHQTWREPLWFRQKLAGTSHLDRLFTRHGYHFTGPPGMVSAQSSRLECFAGEGWLAAGDAAMSFDPLSGAGICKALETAERVADAIEKGGPSGVASYAEWSEERWREYIASRRSYYAMEQRWPEQPFWNSVVCDPLPN